MRFNDLGDILVVDLHLLNLLLDRLGAAAQHTVELLHLLVDDTGRLFHLLIEQARRLGEAGLQAQAIYQR